MADKAPRRVSIIFCGGCNPRIDRGLVAGELARRLAARGCRLVYNDRDADLLVLLSGCTAGCAGRDLPPGIPAVAVAAATVDAVAVPEADLAATVADKIVRHLNMQ
jgi:hypothetical protein